jgi:predicted O-methyltransferase YrrM
MHIERFVTVVQRRVLEAEESLFLKVEHLFAIETHMSMEERVALLDVGMKMPPGFVACEVGSYVGASTAFLAVAAQTRKGHVHCVDTWDNRAMGLELPRDTFEEFRRNTAGFAGFITPHRGESSAVASQVAGGLDLLFIDGDHSYPATLHNLQIYGPKLKPGGVLLLHDFDYATVQQACREYLAPRPARDMGKMHSLQCYQIA